MNKSSKKGLRTRARHRRAHERMAATRTAIVKAETPPPAVVQSVIPTIQQTVQNLERLRRFVTQAMNVDLRRELEKLKKRDDLEPKARADLDRELRKRLEIDWGTIPGVDKPFLLQPGAEKVVFWLNLRPTFVRTLSELASGHLECECFVVLKSKKTGEEVFEGPSASCTTMESNYRFRWLERDKQKMPFPDQKEAEALKRAGLGRWNKKKQWANGKMVAEEWVWLDKVENPNIWDERNKVRQMGQKRALVKAVRNMGAMSELFVSDPSEWDIPPEDSDKEGSPDMDAQFTGAGRRIVTVEGGNERDATEMERYLSRLSPEQRKAEEAALLKEAQDKLRRERERQGIKQPEAIGDLIGELGYRVLGDNRSDRFEIFGPKVLVAAQQDTLRKFYDPRENKILCNGEELEALKYIFEQAGVKFLRREK